MKQKLRLTSDILADIAVIDEHRARMDLKIMAVHSDIEMMPDGAEKESNRLALEKVLNERVKLEALYAEALNQ